MASKAGFQGFVLCVGMLMTQRKVLKVIAYSAFVGVGAMKGMLECVYVFSQALIIWVDKFLIKCYLLSMLLFAKRDNKRANLKNLHFKIVHCEAGS